MTTTATTTTTATITIFHQIILQISHQVFCQIFLLTLRHRQIGVLFLGLLHFLVLLHFLLLLSPSLLPPSPQFPNYNTTFAEKIALADFDPKIGTTQKHRIIMMPKVEEIPKAQKKKFQKQKKYLMMKAPRRNQKQNFLFKNTMKSWNSSTRAIFRHN